MLERSIVLKFWFTIVLTVVLVLFLLGLGLSEILENYYYNRIVEDLLVEGQRIGTLIENTAPDKLVEYLDVVTSVLETHIIIVDNRGVVEGCNSLVGLSLGEFFASEDVNRVFIGETVVKQSLNKHFNAMMLSVAMPVLDNRGNVDYGILMFTPTANIIPTIMQMRRLIMIAAFGGVVLATIIGFFFSRRISNPLLEMNSIALGMAKGNFSNKIIVKSQDEIGILGNTLNHLSGKLKDTINQISQEKNKLEGVLSGMADGVISLDKEGKVILFNPQASNCFCGCSEIMEGSYLFGCSNFATLEECFNEVIAKGETIKRVLLWSNMYYAVKILPLFENEEEKDIIGVIIVIQDVTKETKLEQMRSEFVANVSHELRTPLSLIQGYTEALIDGIAEDIQTKDEYLNIINDESIRLKNLVNDLMDLSRLQSGFGQLNKDIINSQLLLETVAQKFKKPLEHNNISITIHVSENAQNLNADGDRLAQVFTNLIDNAIRHTQNGEIRIKVYSHGEESIFEVWDTGMGIASEDIPLIWDRFYKVDKARTRNQSGTGLGLSIVKSIIDAHEGTISVESKPGNGTVFIIRLPR